MIDVRTATVDDAAVLAELRWEFRASQDEPDEAHDVFVGRCMAWMRRELAASAPWRAWVAVDRQAIAGHVWLQVVEKIPNPVAELERLAYVSNLYVRPSARGGTGTRLLEAVLDWCRAGQIDRVFLWPTPRSVTLYRGHGFVQGGDVMELKIRS